MVQLWKRSESAPQSLAAQARSGFDSLNQSKLPPACSFLPFEQYELLDRIGRAGARGGIFGPCCERRFSHCAIYTDGWPVTIVANMLQRDDSQPETWKSAASIAPAGLTAGYR